jgi:Cytochrome oxidase complex assembly protein 1
MADFLDQPRPQTWWDRNWKWVIGCLAGCLIPVIGFGGIAALIVVFVMGSIKTAEPYIYGLSRAEKNPQVKAALGDPIQAGIWTNGKVNINNDSGSVDITIPVSGPKGSGTIRVVGTRTAKKWEYSTLDFVPNGAGDRIDLRDQPGKGQPAKGQPGKGEPAKGQAPAETEDDDS